MDRTLSLPIHTLRLTLRDFRASDFDAVFAYASDPEVTRFMFYGPRDQEDTHDYLQHMLQSQTQTPRLTWELAVVRRGDGRLIGACDLTIEHALEADLGYILAREAWGQGYATEIASALLRVGFEQLGLQRIFAMCDINHLASVRVLEKAGLRRETTLYGYKEAKGRSWNVYRYAVTRNAWMRSRGAAKDTSDDVRSSRI
jgi:RimJ/RimL family protein N-acetyltransferase